MALVASSISGAAYVLNNNEDKDTGNGFEFTRRKKWPQLLLQELVGSALFCLKPTVNQTNSAGQSDVASSTSSQNLTWKMLFVSPSAGEMLGQKPSDLEGRDFLECVYPADQNQLHNMFNVLLAPQLIHRQSNSSSNSSTQPSTPLMPLSTSTKSQTTYVRMIIESTPSRPSSAKGSSNGQTSSPDQPTTVLWEVRAHATGVEGADMPGGFGLGGAGTMVPQGAGDAEMRGKAVWLMGRRVGEGLAEGEGNGQSLDAFLELKLENEKLRAELRDLQVDYDDDDYRSARPLADPQPPYPTSQSPSTEDSDSSPSSSTPSSPGYAAPPRPAKVGRPPKDKEGREKKRAKKVAVATAVPRANAGGEGEGMHVCVTCGRTDSPEWRKGPLGPKTLCNACGLRWAKRNSTAPARKDKKTTAGK